MTSLLEVENLEKSYGSLKAVDQLSFKVEAGEAFGLLGPNGAGKSTTMMMICGLLEPDAGEVRLDGRKLDRRDPQSRSRLGVVPQDLAIYPDLTARENLRFFSGLYHLSGDERCRRVDEALDRVGLLGRADDLAETFSGGMKRRLNFAAAVMHDPVLLILDEPTVGVDPQSRAHLIDCIRALQRSGTAIIYASHYMEEVQTICSRAAIVDHGRLLACDQIHELLKQIPFEVELRLNRSELPAGLQLGDSASIERDDGEVVVRCRSQSHASEAALNHDVTSILTTLARHSIGVKSIRTQEPNLERLFLKLTGSRLRD
ncbi:MAG: ABC transporter ATP-binding protein [Planctomycetota bacterium]